MITGEGLGTPYAGPMPSPAPVTRSVALVTLGCARNEVDSEELAGRLQAAGWLLVDEAADADVAVVNTCGFVEQAKKDSVDALLEASDLKEQAREGHGRTRAVVAVGCLAERYGKQLAQELPEADAVLGFDSYQDMSASLQAILDGERPASHVPRDRRTLLPMSPALRQNSQNSQTRQRDATVSGAPNSLDSPDLPVDIAPASGPRVVRRRLDGRPYAPLKLASGCDRRCSFCAIPSFRGAFLSRRPADVLTEARWLADQGVREAFLVSENSTSYGKDLGDIRLLETLLPELAAVPGLDRIRVSYLQPAEVRPGLVDVMTSAPGVAPYFDLSFQHSSAPVLRRMRRFGDTSAFLGLIEQIRARDSHAGIRSNVIVGFPGETRDDVAELEDFLTRAHLDVVGVFGYSDEDGTEAATLDGKLETDEIAYRLDRVTRLVEELTSQRAEDRIGELVDVLVEELETDDHPPGDPSQDDRVWPEVVPVGRAAHQGPDVDGTTRLVGPDLDVLVGDLVRARVVGSEGADLLAEVVR